MIWKRKVFSCRHCISSLARNEYPLSNPSDRGKCVSCLSVLLPVVLKAYFDKAPSCHRSVRPSHCYRAGWRISPSCSECVPVGCTQRSHRCSQHLQRLEWSLRLTVRFDVSCCRWNQQHYKSLCLTLVVHCDSSAIILCRFCYLLAVRPNIPVVNLIGWGS